MSATAPNRSTANPPVNQAVNPMNDPVNDTRIAHHSHGHSKDTHDTTTHHEKGGLMHNLFGGSDKHSNEKHHEKSDNHTLTSSHNQNQQQSITSNHLMDAGINTVRNRHSNTSVLASSLANYSNQLAALNQTRQRIAAAFNAVLSEQNSPYSQLAQEYAQAELSLVRNQATIPDRLVDQSYNDFDRRHNHINELVNTLNSQRSTVEHYDQKLTKLFHDRDTAVSSNKTLSAKELERLERNQQKARDAELAYNQTNNQLIEEINYLGVAPVQQLGPALVAFVSGEQMLASQTSAALAKIVIDANTVNSRADMWARSQPHLVPPMTGASHIHGLNANVRDRSLSTSTTQSVSSSTASTASTASTTHDKHHTSTTGTHDKHHTHDKDASNNKDVRSMTDAMGTTMIRSEEQLAIGSERVELERVTMHKYVTSEIINVPITLRREHISIERNHLHDKDRRHSLSTNDRSIHSSTTTGSTTATTGASSTNTNINRAGVTATDSSLNRAGIVAPTGTTANTHANTSSTGLTGTSTTGLHGQNVAGSNVSGTGLHGTGSSYSGSSANVTGTGLHGSTLSNTSESSLNADISGEWDFVLSAEQPVITTRVVPYERVRVRKITDHSTQRISADLRKENIDFTLAPNVQVGGQPEVAIRDVDPTLHRAGPGEVVECMDGNGLVNQSGSGAQQAAAGGLYNKDQSALHHGSNTGTFDKTQTHTQTNQQRSTNENRPLERV